MIIPSLSSLEEELRGTISTLSTKDWSDNRDTLARIRALTSQPRKSAPGLPKRNLLEESANSLRELLALPVNGRPSPGETEPILVTLQSEPDIVKHCNNEGMKSRAIAAAKAIFRSLVQPKEIYKNVWHGSGFYQIEGTTARRLLEAHDSIVNEGHVNGARYRINALILACVYHARVQALGSVAKRESTVLEELVQESSKPRSHITTVLKRGRWYALWVSQLGLGAILTLGESFASANHMQDINHLIKVCRAIPGFRERSQDLSGFARNAIEQAIVLSERGQEKSTALETGQRYINYPGTAGLSSNDQNGTAILGIADSHTLNRFPSVQEVNEQPAVRVPTPASSLVHETPALSQRVENARDLHPQWQLDAQRHHETGAQTASFRPSPIANNPVQATLTGADKALLLPTVDDYNGFSAHSSFTPTQGYDMGPGVSSWEETSYNAQGEAFDLFWNTSFAF